jgi:MoaA/NifB/PqqE/SkfB family radical SAM enzyme
MQMAGATAGSVIAKLPDTPRKDGKLILTVTINNICNLKCDHCYLEYQASSKYMRDDLVEKIFLMNPEIVTIVGKEPLVDEPSMKIVEKIVNHSYNRGVKSYLITNGYNLSKLPLETLKKLSNVDISYHGYSNTGIPNYLEKVENGVRYATKHTHTSLLAVLTDETIKNIDIVIKFAKKNGVNEVYFSPFLHTYKPTSYTVNALDMGDLFHILKTNEAFMNSENTYLLMDMYHIEYEKKYTSDEIDEMIKLDGLEHKVIFHKTLPEKLGIVRLTYDGKVLKAFDALNTLKYDEAYVSFEKFIETMEGNDQNSRVGL